MKMARSGQDASDNQPLVHSAEKQDMQVQAFSGSVRNPNKWTAVKRKKPTHRSIKTEKNAAETALMRKQKRQLEFVSHHTSKTGYEEEEELTFKPQINNSYKVIFVLSLFFVYTCNACLPFLSIRNFLCVLTFILKTCLLIYFYISMTYRETSKMK